MSTLIYIWSGVVELCMSPVSRLLVPRHRIAEYFRSKNHYNVTQSVAYSRYRFSLDRMKVASAVDVLRFLKGGDTWRMQSLAVRNFANKDPLALQKEYRQCCGWWILWMTHFDSDVEVCSPRRV